MSSSHWRGFSPSIQKKSNPWGPGRALIFPNPPSKIIKNLVVSDGGFHTLNEIIAAICVGLGRRPPGFSLPIGPVRALVGLIEKGSQAIGLKPPVTKAIIDKYTEDIAVDDSLIQNELGFEPQYDLKTGWEETIQERQC